MFPADEDVPGTCVILGHFRHFRRIVTADRGIEFDGWVGGAEGGVEGCYGLEGPVAGAICVDY